MTIKEFLNIAKSLSVISIKEEKQAAEIGLKKGDKVVLYDGIINDFASPALTAVITKTTEKRALLNDGKTWIQLKLSNLASPVQYKDDSKNPKGYKQCGQNCWFVLFTSKRKYIASVNGEINISMY